MGVDKEKVEGLVFEMSKGLITLRMRKPYRILRRKNFPCYNSNDGALLRLPSNSHSQEIRKNLKSFRLRHHPREQVFRLRRFPAHPRPTTADHGAGDDIKNYIKKQLTKCQKCELLRKYHRSANGRKCASKVDLRKAYDFVSWHSKLQTLDGTGFPENFISWVKACITSPSFLINGNDNELKEYFPSAKGLKQGYPCHPT